jgi:3-oxoadipate enol-lactonase
MTTGSRYLEAHGARIHYEVDGDGEPVLMVHAGVANLRMWDAQVEALRDAYRVIRHDTRGFGRTETDAVEFSNRADIAAVLDHLGEGSAHLVGLSRGGQIALDFALEFPDRARSLVFSGGGVGGYDAGDEAPPGWEEVEAREEASDWEYVADWETAYWVDGPGQPADRVDPAIRAKVHDWILSNYRAAKEEGTPQPLDPPANERLVDLRVPVLASVGDLDAPGPQAACRHLAATVPGARLEVFAGAAHMANLEQPDRFNRLLREFLDANRGSGPPTAS